MIKSECLKDEKRLVLFSGGADSMALLHLMQSLGELDIVLHFNHNLRGDESNQDEQFCRDYCEENDLELIVVNLDLDKERQANEGDEQLARRLRLQYLEDHYSTWNIYLAHHLDDVKESFFMRAMRGANSSGLCALRRERKLGTLTLIRPLLDYSREQLRSYLKENNLTWREDSSNHDADYCDRNYVRNELMRKLSRLGKGLQHTLKHIAEDDDYLQSAAEKELMQGFTSELFLKLHAALKARVLRLFLENQGLAYVPTQASINRLLKECQNLPEAFKDFPLGEGVELRLWNNGEISVPPIYQEVDWNWQEQEDIEFSGYRFFISSSQEAENFSLSDLPKKFTLRTPQKGDKMQILGQKKKTLLSKLFSDAKLEHQQRCSFPLICASEEIIYLPGLRRGDFACVKEGQDFVGISYEQI